MMGKRYLRTQLKRIIKLAVGIFPTAILLFACLAGAAFMYFTYGPEAKNGSRIRVGIVGNAQDSYLGMGILAVQSFDDTRFLVDFVQMEEKQANEAFLKGEIDGYVSIPDGFIDSVVYGRNDQKISYVVSKEQKGITGMVMDDLSQIAAALIISSQNAVYGMQEILLENGMQEHYQEYTNDLNLRLIDKALCRTNLAQVKILGIALGLSSMQYYYCTILLLFAFLLGICAAPYFWHRENELGRLLGRKRVTAFKQVGCEYLAYLLFVETAVLIPMSIVSVLSKVWLPDMPAIELKQVLPAMGILLLSVAAFHFFLFEITQSTIAVILTQAAVVTGMAYLSGYMFPAGFFPEGLAMVGRILPTGAALGFLSGAVTGEFARIAFLEIICYTVIFLVGAVLIRRRKLAGDVR